MIVNAFGDPSNIIDTHPKHIPAFDPVALLTSDSFRVAVSD
jgi:hypothetical protein